MGLLETITGGRLRVRVKPKPSPTDRIPIQKRGGLEDLLEIDSSKILGLEQLEKFRTLAEDRETQYRIYDEMTKDTIISSAVDMYADDSTQYNSKSQVIWAESEDPDIAAFANRLIDILNLNMNAWSHIYSMVKFGDVYLELYKDDEIADDLIKKKVDFATLKVARNRAGAKLEEYVEQVNNPSEIFDLIVRGKTSGFIKIPNRNLSSGDRRDNFFSYNQEPETVVLPPDKYVHITLGGSTNRFPEELTLKIKQEGDRPEKEMKYTVRRGKSVLHDIYQIYREVKLMEDAILLNRVTKSSIIRLLQIEVGDMPKNQARELLKRIKNIIEQKNFMDKNTGTYTSLASPGPIDNVIYVPVREGKGTITASNIGGDVDVKSLVDLDYFKNKLYGGLKIPKQFLGDTDDAAGFSGGTSLTKLDSRYARTIKRIQNAYISGITTLINIFAIDKGMTDYVNNFSIKMVSPSTVEDQERDDTSEHRINNVSAFMNLLEGVSNDETKKKIIIYFVSNVLGEPEVAALLSAVENQVNEGEDEENDDDGEFTEEFSPSSFSSEPSNPPGGSEEESPESGQEGQEEELGPEEIIPGVNEPEEFGDFSEEV